MNCRALPVRPVLGQQLSVRFLSLSGIFSYIWTQCVSKYSDMQIVNCVSAVAGSEFMSFCLLSDPFKVLQGHSVFESVPIDAGEHHEWFGYLSSAPPHINELSNWFNEVPHVYSFPDRRGKKMDLTFLNKSWPKNHSDQIEWKQTWSPSTEQKENTCLELGRVMTGMCVLYSSAKYFIFF